MLRQLDIINPIDPYYTSFIQKRVYKLLINQIKFLQG